MVICEWCKTEPVRAGRDFCSRRCASFARHDGFRKRGYRYTTVFSDEEIAAAMALVNSGWTWKAAAEHAGMTESAFRRRAQSSGNKYRVGYLAAYAPLKIQMPEDPAELGYLAAMIDGEGHVVISKGKVVVGISNTSKELMQYLEEIGGGATLKRPSQNSRLHSRSPCWTWQLSGRRDVIAFLEAIEPYMIIKRVKAHAALDLLRGLLLAQGME